MEVVINAICHYERELGRWHTRVTIIRNASRIEQGSPRAWNVPAEISEQTLERLAIENAVAFAQEHGLRVVPGKFHEIYRSPDLVHFSQKVHV